MGGEHNGYLSVPVYLLYDLLVIYRFSESTLDVGSSRRITSGEQASAWQWQPFESLLLRVCGPQSV
jgi:hypothetical protein